MSNKPAKEGFNQTTYTGDDAFSDARMLSICKRLKYNPLGRMLIDFAILMEADIFLTNDIETAGYYERTIFDDHNIYLNADCDDYTLFVALAHELRHLAQNVTIDCTLHDFPLDQAILLNQYLEADASVYSNAVAYAEFEKTGDHKFIKASDVYAEADIMAAFTSMLTPATDITDNVAAFQAGFKAWFTNNERVSHYDSAVAKARDAFNDNVFSKFYDRKSLQLSENIVKSVAAIKPGVNYLKSKGAPKVNV